MLKGQLSRVPWPGNSWMPFTSSLLFGRFNSPTNIRTHSSKLFTLN